MAIQQNLNRASGPCPVCGNRRKPSASTVVINAMFSLARICGETYAAMLVQPTGLRVLLFTLAGLELVTLVILGHKQAGGS